MGVHTLRNPSYLAAYYMYTAAHKGNTRQPTKGIHGPNRGLNRALNRALIGPYRVVVGPDRVDLGPVGPGPYYPAADGEQNYFSRICDVPPKKHGKHEKSSKNVRRPQNRFVGSEKEMTGSI